MNYKYKYNLKAATVLTYISIGVLIGAIIKTRILPIKSGAASDILMTISNALYSCITILSLPIMSLTIINMILESENVSFKRTLDISILGFVTYIFITAITILASLPVINAVLGLIEIDAINFDIPIDIEPQQEMTLPQVFLAIFDEALPYDIFYMLNSTNILQIVILSTLMGFAIRGTRNSGSYVSSILRSATNALYTIVYFVMYIAHINLAFIFIRIIINANGNITSNIFRIFLSFNVVCLIQIAIVILITIVFSKKLKLESLISCISSPAIKSGILGNNIIVIPEAINALERKCGIKRYIANIVLPFMNAANTQGTAMYFTILTLFVIASYGIEITWYGRFALLASSLIVSLGINTKPGGLAVFGPTILMSVGLPMESLITVHIINAMSFMVRSAMTVCYSCCITILVHDIANMVFSKIAYHMHGNGK